MAKTRQPGRPTMPRRLIDGINQAFDLLETGKPTQALPLLLDLDHAYPNTLHVLANLVNAYFDLKDMFHYEYALRRLLRIESTDPDMAYALASAHLLNLRPALAIHAFQAALSRWPNHPQAPEALKEIPRVEAVLREQAAEYRMTEEEALPLIEQHEELRYCLDFGEFGRGRQVAEKLLRSYPNFVPALNNLSQIYAAQGEFERAFRTSLRAVEIEPENIHTLSNLARMSFLRGHPEEAAAYAQRLKNSHAKAADRWPKIAEALTYLEDDEGVLALVESARAANELEPPAVNEIFYHLAAVAALHRGREKDARAYWQLALKINPRFDLALKNVEDLDKPEDERGGVWAVPFSNWQLSSVAQELNGYWKKLKKAAKKSDVQGLAARFLEEKHPQVLFLAPHMIERGDPLTRDFVVGAAALTAHPVLVSATKAFIHGKRGSFQERMQAAHALIEVDLLSPGSIHMWARGELRDLLLLDMEVSPDPIPTHRPKKVADLSEQASQALREQDGLRAQDLLEQALALLPDDPGLINNLAMAANLQGQKERTTEIIQDLYRRFPDYPFGVIAMASLEAIEGHLDRAHELLDGLAQRKELHVAEFTSLCRIQIELALLEKKPGAARNWFEMLEKIEPDAPDLKSLQRQIGPPRKG